MATHLLEILMKTLPDSNLDSSEEVLNGTSSEDMCRVATSVASLQGSTGVCNWNLPPHSSSEIPLILQT
ncbi:hypothetical protein EV1_007148 [Malus domestica]